ncbi:uncharacterized protein UTRI_02344 [Ustilago trichophora]|uniref:Uncharacterized protein n=1 Tax=Ustilago trichophora TaxID=86804 RepID=A0A5C3E7F0_9BASI|nr:uncharacterized protein UTRI_02344 [Ustilago trichophora]
MQVEPANFAHLLRSRRSFLRPILIQQPPASAAPKNQTYILAQADRNYRDRTSSSSLPHRPTTSLISHAFLRSQRRFPSPSFGPPDANNAIITADVSPATTAHAANSAIKPGPRPLSSRRLSTIQHSDNDDDDHQHTSADSPAPIVQKVPDDDAVIARIRAQAARDADSDPFTGSCLLSAIQLSGTGLFAANSLDSSDEAMADDDQDITITRRRGAKISACVAKVFFLFYTYDGNQVEAAPSTSNAALSRREKMEALAARARKAHGETQAQQRRDGSSHGCLLWWRQPRQDSISLSSLDIQDSDQDEHNDAMPPLWLLNQACQTKSSKRAAAAVKESTAQGQAPDQKGARDHAPPNRRLAREIVRDLPHPPQEDHGLGDLFNKITAKENLRNHANQALVQTATTSLPSSDQPSSQFPPASPRASMHRSHRAAGAPASSQYEAPAKPNLQTSASRVAGLATKPDQHTSLDDDDDADLPDLAAMVQKSRDQQQAEKEASVDLAAEDDDLLIYKPGDILSSKHNLPATPGRKRPTDLLYPAGHLPSRNHIQLHTGSKRELHASFKHTGGAARVGPLKMTQAQLNATLMRKMQTQSLKARSQKDGKDASAKARLARCRQAWPSAAPMSKICSSASRQRQKWRTRSGPRSGRNEDEDDPDFIMPVHAMPSPADEDEETKTDPLQPGPFERSRGNTHSDEVGRAKPELVFHLETFQAIDRSEHALSRSNTSSPAIQHAQPPVPLQPPQDPLVIPQSAGHDEDESFRTDDIPSQAADLGRFFEPTMPPPPAAKSAMAPSQAPKSFWDQTQTQTQSQTQDPSQMQSSSRPPQASNAPREFVRDPSANSALGAFFQDTQQDELRGESLDIFENPKIAGGKAHGFTQFFFDGTPPPSADGQGTRAAQLVDQCLGRLDYATAQIYRGRCVCGLRRAQMGEAMDLLDPTPSVLPSFDESQAEREAYAQAQAEGRRPHVAREDACPDRRRRVCQQGQKRKSAFIEGEAEESEDEELGGQKRGDGGGLKGSLVTTTPATLAKTMKTMRTTPTQQICKSLLTTNASSTKLRRTKSREHAFARHGSQGSGRLEIHQKAVQGGYRNRRGRAGLNGIDAFLDEDADLEDDHRKIAMMSAAAPRSEGKNRGAFDDDEEEEDAEVRAKDNGWDSDEDNNEARLAAALHDRIKGFPLETWLQSPHRRCSTSKRKAHFGAQYGRKAPRTSSPPTCRIHGRRHTRYRSRYGSRRRRRKWILMARLLSRPSLAIHVLPLWILHGSRHLEDAEPEWGNDANIVRAPKPTAAGTSQQSSSSGSGSRLLKATSSPFGGGVAKSSKPKAGSGGSMLLKQGIMGRESGFSSSSSSSR